MKRTGIFVLIFLTLAILIATGLLQSPASSAMAGYADPKGLDTGWTAKPIGQVYSVPSTSTVFKVGDGKTHRDSDLATH